MNTEQERAELRRLCQARDEQRDGRLAALERAAKAETDVTALVEALECMIIGACAVAVPHNGERAVLQDAVSIARAALAAYRKQRE